MIDVRNLFKAGKRYRGFIKMEDDAVPATFTVFPLNAKELRLKYFFPTHLSESLNKGSIIYCLVEEGGKNLIGELRVVRKEDKSVRVSVDFLTEDRRSLPRVRIKDVLSVYAEVECDEIRVKGEVIDISMTSVAVEIGGLKEGSLCKVTLSYGARRIVLEGKVVRQMDDVAVFHLGEGNGDMVSLLGKIYTDLFLKMQRSG